MWTQIQACIRLVLWGREIVIGPSSRQQPSPPMAPVVESSRAPGEKTDLDPRSVRREILGLHASLSVLERELQLIQGEQASDK